MRKATKWAANSSFFPDDDQERFPVFFLLVVQAIESQGGSKLPAQGGFSIFSELHFPIPGE
jgi:hypothetical protein